MSPVVQRDGKGFRLISSIELPAPLAEVFSFFSDAHNLEALTPPSLRFEILTPDPIVMRQGLLIDYRLRVHRIPLRWQSEITAWDPPHRFVDEQRRGPYRWWKHEHRFEAKGNRTLVSDDVRYSAPGGALIHRLLVAPDLRRIFEYRSARLRAVFPGPAPRA